MPAAAFLLTFFIALRGWRDTFCSQVKKYPKTSRRLWSWICVVSILIAYVFPGQTLQSTLPGSV